MTKLFSFRLQALIVIILSITVIASCKKKDEVNSGKVELLSFGPTGAKHGDTLRFIGLNLNKVTAIKFTGTGATVQQADFKKQDGKLILLIVPATAEKGLVTLTTTDGDLVTKTQFNLSVTTGVTTMTKLARPGENVTITGTFLNWVDRITFASGKLVTTFVSQSQTQLVVKIPDDAETGPLILHYLGTDSADLRTADTLKVKLPVATAFAPNPVLHATNVTITGTDLDLTKKVFFNGVPAAVTTFVSQSATQLVVKVPGSTTKGKIKLLPLSGIESVSASDLDVRLPSITALAPSPIDTGTNLTITGIDLNLVTSISFVGPAPVTTFVSQSATQIVVKVPFGTLKGKLTFGVLNSTLTVQSPVDLLINGGLPPLADFPFAIYTDALQNTFQDWSYTDSHDFNNTEVVRQGTKAIKTVYAASGYTGTTFHAGTGAVTAGYTTLEFSVFGTAGTDGKKLNVVVNGNYSTPPQVTIVGGAWTTFSITLASLGGPNPLNELVLQSAGWAGTIYIDHVGLR